MKTFLISSVSLLFVFSGLSQEGLNPQKPKLGISIGSTKSFLNIDRPNEQPMLVVEQFGFRIGMNMTVPLNDQFAVSPKLDLAFYTTEIGLADAENNQAPYKIMPAALELAGHFVYTPTNWKVNPYFLAGPKFGSSLYLPKSHDEFETEPNFSLEIGMGLHKALPNFNMMPELRYSFGVFDINGHPELEKVRMNALTLVLTFNK